MPRARKITSAYPTSKKKVTRRLSRPRQLSGDTSQVAFMISGYAQAR